MTEQEMSKEQAFSLVDRVCSGVQLNRADNGAVVKALQIIAAELSKKPEATPSPVKDTKVSKA